jgi:acetylcholinesterase
LQFGGDPNAVVIHGASAGAGSIALHLTAYGGRNDNLFGGAIGESLFCPRHPKVADLEFQFDRFANDSGCANSENQISCLRALDTAVLQASNVPHPYAGAVADPRFYWSPTVDGDLIRDYPYIMFEKGAFIEVPILFGNDNDEGSLYGVNAGTPAEVASFMHDNYPNLSQTDLDAINEVYPLMEPLPQHAAYFPSSSAAYGEATFTCPTITLLQSFEQYFDFNKTWSYRYNVQDQGNINSGIGVPHTFELDAIFGLGYAGSYNEGYATYNKAIIPVVQDYFISFIRALNPNRYKNEAAPQWDAYTHEQKRLVLQTNVSAMESVPKEQLTRCKFWKGLGVTMEI